MRSYFVSAVALCVGIACGGTDVIITNPDAAVDTGVTPDVTSPPPDTSPPQDVCVPQTEICGDLVDNDCDGTVDNGCKGIGTFVSGQAGNDTNPGTKTSPVKTIAKGIANAQSIGGALTVYVA